MVSENLEQVKANIEAACKRVGRDPKRCASCCCQQDKADFFN